MTGGRVGDTLIVSAAEIDRAMAEAHAAGVGMAVTVVCAVLRGEMSPEAVGQAHGEPLQTLAGILVGLDR